MNHQLLHLAHMMRGDRPPLSLPISSSISLASKQRPLLLTLISELALLLVARGESETLTVLLRDGPDRTLYIEEAGIFVINGRRLPGMLRLISCSIIVCIVLNKNMKFLSKLRCQKGKIEIPFHKKQSPERKLDAYHVSYCHIKRLLR